MESIRQICLLSDSFAPVLDGVANVVQNYAASLHRRGVGVAVGTPYQSGDRGGYPYPVVRYPSLNTAKRLGYRAGYPFSFPAAEKLASFHPQILHSHCPFSATLLARTLRPMTGAPIVLTYHTKFDVDIARALPQPFLQEAALRELLKNIEACDEVWAVSRGAGENLRRLGYEGAYVVMENGVDMPRGRPNPNEAGALLAPWPLPADTPVYFFVGRMMWYKGQRLILEGLRMLGDAGLSARMVFVGDGADRMEIERAARTLGVGGLCLFTGAIRDRAVLRAWYGRADLFLFPSSFDTNGIVVREAAAAGLPSVLIRGSAAAEGIEDGKTGFLIEESGAALGSLLVSLHGRADRTRRVGENAMNGIVLSWEDSVGKALRRYGDLMNTRAACRRPRADSPFFEGMAALIETTDRLQRALRPPRPGP